MICPNCGQPYEEHETICSQCGQPLSNASYTPVDANSSKEEKKPPVRRRRRYRKIMIFLLILILLAAIATAGYHYYIYQIEKQCRAAVDEIFTMAQDMDFSAVGSSYLPEILQKNPNIKELIEEQLEKSLEENDLKLLLDYAGVEMDTDELCDEIIRSASYEITDVQTTYNSCTITVHTENIDYSSLFSSLSGEVTEALSETTSSESIWESIRDAIFSLFSSHGGEEQEDHEEEEEQDILTDVLQPIYEEAKENASRTTTDGTIVFGIQDRQWTLLSIDENLFYSYYGISLDY
ncbi:MAG: zinc ribbon domain-containing protein [Clostridiales bacterium]|nr:zinc ribbon domain-containing protein [Clostridiales bacterium]